MSNPFHQLRNWALSRRYEQRRMLKNYLVAQWRPYVSDNPYPSTEDFYSRLLEKAKPYIRPDSLVLDIGCGLGRLVFEYEQLGAQKVVGIDSSRRFISFCHRLKQGSAKGIRLPFTSSASVFIRGDIIKVKFEKPFAFISCVNVIDRVSDPVALLEKIHSLLALGGAALLVTPYDWELSPVPRRKRFQDMKARLDSKKWALIEETQLPYSMPLGQRQAAKTYDCHLVLVRKL